MIHLKNYINQKIWLTKLDEFNDPFEGHFHFKHATAQEILNHKILFDHYYNLLKPQNPHLTQEDLRSELLKPEADTLLGATRYENNIFSNYGAICFSSSKSNIPMWAHYANYHRGYCVEFEVDLNYLSQRNLGIELNKVFNPMPDGSDQEILSFRQSEDDNDKHFVFTKIIYKNIKPSLEEKKILELASSSEYERFKYLATNSFGVKFTQWSYEDEYRLIVNANSKISGLMDLQGYPFIKIKNIILGFNFGQNLNEDAINFLNHNELNGNKFKSNSIEDKAREFTSSLINKNSNVYISHARCSTDNYKIIT